MSLYSWKLGIKREIDVMIDLLSMLSREKPTVTEANQRETGKQGELIHLADLSWGIMGDKYGLMNKIPLRLFITITITLSLENFK